METNKTNRNLRRNTEEIKSELRALGCERIAKGGSHGFTVPNDYFSAEKPVIERLLSLEDSGSQTLPPQYFEQLKKEVMQKALLQNENSGDQQNSEAKIVSISKRAWLKPLVAAATVALIAVSFVLLNREKGEEVLSFESLEVKAIESYLLSQSDQLSESWFYDYVEVEHTDEMESFDSYFEDNSFDLNF